MKILHLNDLFVFIRSEFCSTRSYCWLDHYFLNISENNIRWHLFSLPFSLTSFENVEIWVIFKIYVFLCLQETVTAEMNLSAKGSMTTAVETPLNVTSGDNNKGGTFMICSKNAEILLWMCLMFLTFYNTSET